MQEAAVRLFLINHGCLVRIPTHHVLAVLNQLRFLHGIKVHLILKDDRVLRAILYEVMRCALFPSVKDRLMPPLVVAPP